MLRTQVFIIIVALSIKIMHEKNLAEAKSACLRAMEFSPSDSFIYYDSRGFVRTMTEDYKGAIEDFEAYIEWSKQNGMYEIHGEMREAWIVKLKAGVNPFK